MIPHAPIHPTPKAAPDRRPGRGLNLAGIAPAFVAVLWPWGSPPQKSPGLDGDQIRKATASLCVEHVLGWAYSDNLWTRGARESAAVGEEAFPDKGNVRAVCLGKEGGHYVFFTLRSFLDPFYPNPAIQGLPSFPVGPDGDPVEMGPAEIEDSEAVRDAHLIRYGKMRFAWYEDLGGGKFRVANKVDSVTLYDAMEEGPVSLNQPWLGMGGAPEEKFRGGKYRRPHEQVSVEEHFRMRELGLSQGAAFRFIGTHDVAMIYVPEGAFAGGGAPPPPSLGIEQPSLAVDLYLRHSRSLFGFDFVLMGQETLDKVRRYRPPDAGDGAGGFEKLGCILGLALDPQTLMMIKAVDTALDEVLPPPEAVEDIRALWAYWKTIRPDVLVRIGRELVPIMQGNLGLPEGKR